MTWLLALACTAPSTVEPAATCAPASVHLTALSGVISGQVTAPVALADQDLTGATAQLEVPSDAAVVTVWVTGGSTLSVIPLVGDAPLDEQRVHRELVQSVGTDPVQVDLTPALSSWGDAGQGTLRAVVLETDGVLVRAQVFGGDALVTEPAQARSFVDQGRGWQSWVVQGGASVSLRVPVPAGGVLRWQDLQDAGPRWVSVEGDRVAEVTGTGPQAVDLSHLAGRTVTVELGTDGTGAGVFGAPRVVVPDAQGCAPSVLVYLVDTLRADAVGPVYTPWMDQHRSGGVTYDAAWSSSAWTKPAMVSLLTSQLAPVHQVGGGAYTERLASHVPVVQQRFAEGGWRTGSFVANPLGGALSGLDRGFDRADQPAAWPDRGPLAHPTAEQVRGSFLDWLDAEPDQPFFALVHTLEPHEWAGPAYAGQDPQTRYRASVADADRHFGQLMAELERRERLSNTIVVVLSDHGESLGEHGIIGHGSALFEDQVRIPLAIAGPGVGHGSVSEPVSLVDVAPTLLALVGLPALPDVDGRVLPAPDQPGRDRVTASILRYLGVSDTPPQHAQRDGAGHKVMAWEGGQHLVFDLATDPQELQDAQDPALRDALLREIDAQAARGDALGAVEAGTAQDAVMEALQALGYLQTP